MPLQNLKTAVIYGMPKAAIKTGCIDEVVELDKIANAITYQVNER